MDKDLKEVVRVAKNNGAESKYLAGISFEKEEKFREAFRWFLESANDGHIEAQIKIGDYYANGTFIKQDYSKSVLWYTRASTYGNSEALIKLANLYKDGLGTEKDLKLAYDLYHRASSNCEDADALYQLAIMAKHGLGTTSDIQSAFVWFKKASDLGHVKATANLGYCYANGSGVAKDAKTAFDCYVKASEGGSVIATFNLAVCYKEGFGCSKNIDKAIELFKVCADKEHSLSYTYLAECYAINGADEQVIIDCYENAYAQGSYKACYHLSKIYETKEDHLRQIEWLLKGQNDVDCLRELGILCYEGEIAQLDYKKSFECFYKASGQGDVTSTYYLAVSYLEGHGVDADEDKAMALLAIASDREHVGAMMLYASKIQETNPGKALELLEKCADAGEAEAYYTLAKWYGKGYIAEKDETKAFKYYTKASEAGNHSAMCNLGIAYVNGIGTKVCPELGVYWFKKAVEGDIVSARFNLAYCYEMGVGTSKDIHAAVNLYSSAGRDGHIDSCLRLGEVYMNDETLKDYQSAIYWLNIAMEKGNKKAYELLATIYGSEAYYDKDKLNYIKEMMAQ